MANRLLYLSIPPNVFVDVAQCASRSSSTNGWTRVIVEKTFGRDPESSAELTRDKPANDIATLKSQLSSKAFLVIWRMVGAYARTHTDLLLWLEGYPPLVSREWTRHDGSDGHNPPFNKMTAWKIRSRSWAHGRVVQVCRYWTDVPAKRSKSIKNMASLNYCRYIKK
eukprot:Gb_02548 [translate_table: standard]